MTATVIALGGTAAVADATLAAVAAGRATDRLAGGSRFDTAAAIAGRAFPPEGKVATVYLARGDVFADAVASGSLTDGPVLLVQSCGALPEAVTGYLTAAQTDSVIALGGTAAVCDQVLTDAAAINGTTPPPTTPPTQPPTTPPTTPPPPPSGEFDDTEIFFERTGFNSYRFDTQQVTNEFDDTFGFTMTPDGSQFLWPDTLGDVINWHDVRSKEQIDTTELPISALSTRDPQASPDGSFVAYVADTTDDADGFPLLVVDRDGNDVLDDDPDTLASIPTATDQVWSPQGELYVTFVGSNGTAFLGRVNFDQQIVESIREYPSEDSLPFDLAVSPDGTQMAYTYQSHLWLLDLASGEHQQLTTSQFKELGATFSPDGSQILFHLVVVSIGNVFYMPNGDYAEPVRVEPYDTAEEIPPDAGYKGVIEEDGFVLFTIGFDTYWFPQR